MVTVISATRLSGEVSPVSQFTPDGQSTATTIGFSAVWPNILFVAPNTPPTLPRKGNFMPVPSTPSIRIAWSVSSDFNFLYLGSPLASRISPPLDFSRFTNGSSSGLFCTIYTVAFQPHSAIFASATRVSPPLLPEPTSPKTPPFLR